MTHREALQEARRRWGAAGDIAYEGNASAGSRYVVGTKGAARDGIAYGRGGTYEEAFANAAEKATKAVCT